MKTQYLYSCSLAALLALTTGTAVADPVRVLTIDDFTMGPFQQVMPPLAAGWRTDYQSAPNVLGGVRETNLIADDTLGQPSSIAIEGGRLVVSTGIGSYFGAFLRYGHDVGGNSSDTVGCLEGYDYFQIDFERSDLGLNYIVEVIDGNGTLATRSGTLSGEAQSGPHGVQLPLEQFEVGDATGNPPSIEWRDIRSLIVLFQSANASGGNDLSVTSIIAVDSAKDTSSPDSECK